jgi:hypothetical protein
MKNVCAQELSKAELIDQISNVVKPSQIFGIGRDVVRGGLDLVDFLQAILPSKIEGCRVQVIGKLPSRF